MKISIAIFIILVMFGLSVAIVSKMGRESVRESIKPIDGSAFICTSQPYGTPQDKWQRMTTKNRRLALLLKEDGMAETAAPQTLECMHNGNKIYLRETWWRRIPRQRHACGDYTKPYIPKIKVTSV